MKLNKLNVAMFMQIALLGIVSKGTEYFAWKNSPIHTNDHWQVEVGYGDSKEVKVLEPTEAETIFGNKINSAYSERFAMTVGTIVGLVNNGYNVEIVQTNNESTPFNADGWSVIVVEGMPIFHISPDDIKLTPELVSVVDSEDPRYSYKKTNKLGEFTALLRGSVESGLNLLEIAQQNS